MLSQRCCQGIAEACSEDGISRFEADGRVKMPGMAELAPAAKASRLGHRLLDRLYLQDIVKAERHLELWRVGARHERGLSAVHAALAGALQAEAQRPTKRPRPSGDLGAGDGMDLLRAHVAAGVLRYEVYRQRSIAARGWVYKDLEVHEVRAAFTATIVDFGLLPES